jgi:serpin B
MKRFWKYITLVAVALMTATTAFATTNAEGKPEDAQSAESQHKTSDNNSDFACNLFRTITEQKKGNSSTIVSPISVSYVLGMLNAGADSITRQQITNVLGLDGSVQEINEYFKKLMDEAQSVDPKVTVKIANCLEVISNDQIKLQYKADMENYYSAQVGAGDLGAGGIVNKINNWCKMHTDGMIPKILSEEEINPNSVMFLLNAIYFKASWTKKFNSKESCDKDFTKQDGTIVKHMMMHRKTGANYGQNDLCKMLRLPYGSNGWSMYVLLPNEGKTIGDIIQSLSAQKLEEQRAKMTPETVDILMPRFSTESEIHFEKVLSLMGMPRAFGMDAEFPNMVEDLKDVLYVSMMKQKAKIEVTEEGTKAAAVTIAGMAKKSLSIGGTPQKIMEFHATRPFVYYIMEESTGSIFFMGTYCGDSKKIELETKKESGKQSEDIICTNIEQITRFPGGGKALMRYIQSHTNVPYMAAVNGFVDDKVIVQFAVDKDGKVGDIKVVRSADEYLDKEAVRVIKSLPRFKPISENDKAEPEVYILPVVFKL